MKMSFEDFDKLRSSNNKFDNLTGTFIEVMLDICVEWELGNAVKLYEYEWDNVLIMSEAHKLEAIDCDIDDDVDESFYDPYMGCDCYDDCRIDEF